MDFSSIFPWNTCHTDNAATTNALVCVILEHSVRVFRGMYAYKLAVVSIKDIIYIMHL